MPSWFDIYVLGNARDFTGKQDDEGTLKSAAAINELIDAEVAALGSARRVFLGGFSQGGALTLHVGLNYKEKLGGLVVCSAYYPLSYNEDKYVVLYFYCRKSVASSLILVCSSRGVLWPLPLSLFILFFVSPSTLSRRSR